MRMADKEAVLGKGDSSLENKDLPCDMQATERSDIGTPEESSDNGKIINTSAECYTDTEVDLQTDIAENVDAKNTVFEDSPLSKSVDFMYETKYVLLNFMSLIPPDMYRGHISTSPEPVGFEPHFGKRLAKSGRYLSKSKSFDTGIQHRKPTLKLLGKMKTLQKHIDSPASEDNVSYHHQNNLNKLDSPDSQRFNSDPFSPQPFSHMFEKSHSAHEFSSHSSPSRSPEKSIHSPQRLFSDASSSGELSYMSDADDEYEEYSNASSIFSTRSISSRDGFLDLRRSVHILPTLLSQSEYMDEPDACSAKTDNQEPQTHTETEGGLATVKEISEGLQQSASNVDDATRIRQPADRSKLKLNIPCEPLQLDDILLSLHTELSSELDELESEFEEALKSARDSMAPSGRPTLLTPQSEAARVLARIGDEVKEQYGGRLTEAVNRLTYQQITNMSYQQFRDVAQSVVCAEVPGWRQVALLMVFGQKIIWGAVQQGQTHFGNLIDYSSQLVAEFAADFIIKQGGWGSVMNFDPSSDTQSSENFDTSPEMVVDYFTSHDITQVESEKDLNNEMEQDEERSAGKPPEEYVIKHENGGYLPGNMPNTLGMRTLSIEGLSETTSTITKSRYASSVGFDYTDDVAEIDVKTDSEEDKNMSLFEPEDTDRHDNGTGTRATVTETQVTPEIFPDGISNYNHEPDEEVTNDLSTTDIAHDIKHETEIEVRLEQHKDETETIAQQTEVQDSNNDLSSGNIPQHATSSEYDKESVYVRQETPTASVFAKVNEGNGEADINVANATEAAGENHIAGFKDNENDVTVLGNKYGVEESNDITILTESSLSLVGKKESDLEKVQDPDSNTSAMKQHQIDKVAKADGQKDTETVNNNNIHVFCEDFSNSEYGLIIPTAHSYDLDSCNESIKHSVKEDDGSHTDDDYAVSDINEGDVNDKEGESHTPSFIQRMGVKVAAVAVAVLVLGISVRLATLNR